VGLVAQQWLIARVTVGWPCGIHASLHRLVSCFAGRITQDRAPRAVLTKPDGLEYLRKASSRAQGRLHFITILRNPAARFLSEFLNHFSGWSRRNDGLNEMMIASRYCMIYSDYYCNGTLRPEPPSCRDYSAPFVPNSNQTSSFALTRGEILAQLSLKDRSPTIQDRMAKYLKAAHKSQLSDEDLLEVGDKKTLWEFLRCPHNPAVNRQARMLAFMPCFRHPRTRAGIKAYEEAMLSSAIEALEALPYFAIAEYPNESRMLFEWTFGLQFKDSSSLLKSPEEVSPAKKQEHHALNDPEVLRYVNELNHIDSRLYDTALKIFEQRLNACGPYCI
jgi:hypothetical protein